MNFRTFKLTSKIDETDTMTIEIDMDTIDDDEPTMNLIEESLDVCEHLLAPHSQEFSDAWENDDQFFQCVYDMVSDGEKIPVMQREKYTIELMD